MSTHTCVLFSFLTILIISTPVYSHVSFLVLNFRKMLSDDDRYFVPEVIPELSTKQVLTTELISGIPLDQVAELDQETRNYVSRENNF